MNNEEIYKRTFANALGLALEDVEDAIFKNTPQWDSVGHVNLIAQLEETFGIVLDADDILDFLSYESGKTILSQKHGIRFDG